jgi:hypothetical protein
MASDIQEGRKMNGPRLVRLGLTTAALTLLSYAGIVRAQQEGPPPGRWTAFSTHGPGAADEIGFLGFEAGITGKTVTGAPFKATISTQVTRLLADGNKIQQTTSGTLARDSQGRTRREMSLPPMAMVAPGGNAPEHAVFINDPVAGTSYIVHPESKTAEQVQSHQWKRNAEHAPKVGRFGKAFQNNVTKTEGTTADLGTQTINGVSAQGTRITRTIPAGEIGNERPIVMVTERWYAPELQTYVMTKRSDPLMGDTVFQLTNIQRQEPDPALFEVPSDYSVTQGARGAARFHAGPGTETPQPQR